MQFNYTALSTGVNGIRISLTHTQSKCCLPKLSCYYKNNINRTHIGPVSRQQSSRSITFALVHLQSCIISHVKRFPSLVSGMYPPCVFLITSHSGFARTIKDNYFSWHLLLNRAAGFCRISSVLGELHCWALLREFLLKHVFGDLTGRVKFTKNPLRSPDVTLVQYSAYTSFGHVQAAYQLHERLNAHQDILRWWKLH